MPLTKRSISPVDVSLHRLPPNVRQNELECVANGTLANLVRQMSSLSKHAEDIFGELYREAMKIEHKTSTFLNRIDRIASKVTQLDSTIEEVSLQDLHLRKPFKSSPLIDQQSLNRQTMPVAMAECYTCCDKPPELDKLNPYRTDGKLALKFYTDPDYFFELWRQEMLKDADSVKKTKNVSKSKSGQNLDKKHKNKEKHKNTNREGNYLPKDILQPQPLKNTPLTQNHAVNRQGPNSAIYASNQFGSAHPPINGDGIPELTNGRATYNFSGAIPHAGLLNSANSTAYGSLVSSDDLLPTNQQNAGLNYRPINILRRGGEYQTYGAYNNAVTDGEGIGHRMASVGSPADHNQSPSDFTDQSKSGCTGVANSRPNRPPPAPPTNQQSPATQLNGPMADMRLVDQYGAAVSRHPQHTALYGDDVRLQQNCQAPSTSPPPPPPPLPLFNQSATTNPNFTPTNSQPPPSLGYYGKSNCVNSSRSMSPDLPPPPPPLYGADLVDDFLPVPNKNVSAPVVGVAKSAPSAPPPPPPPPPPSQPNWNNRPVASLLNGGDWSAGNKLTNQVVAQKLAPPPDDGRSDLLRAIRDGIQLKKVGRMEEKQRERAALAQGHHDVAAILRKRMEDVMGRQSEESDDEDNNGAEEGSASGFEDDWDD